MPNQKTKPNMKITLEISMYPLNREYESHILEFIHRLHHHKNIVVKTNATATHVVGEFDDVFKALKDETKASFATGEKFVIVTKIINSELEV
jgi:uncharacterized protein YqgV (UPF0045/DUF77 family)